MQPTFNELSVSKRFSNETITQNSEGSVRINCVFSFLFNTITALNLSSQPEYKLETSSRDIEVTDDGIRTLFKLLKGLAIENASSRRFATTSLFLSKRFSLIISELSDKLTEYTVSRERHSCNALYHVKGY